MYTMLIGALAGIATLTGLLNAWDHPVLSTIAAVLVFFVVMLVINLLFRKKIQAVFEVAQQHVMDAQEEIQRQIRMMQAKNMTGGKAAQKKMEKKQEEGFLKAIESLDAVHPYERWNLLAGKQANTLRARLYYQIRDFENADKYFDNILPMRVQPDPLIACMRLAGCGRTSARTRWRSSTSRRSRPSRTRRAP